MHVRMQAFIQSFIQSFIQDITLSDTPLEFANRTMPGIGQSSEFHYQLAVITLFITNCILKHG
jgi:hypothetical protein